MVIGMTRSMAQIASFSFGGPDSSPGWTNVSGDPAHAVQTATAAGITLSSVSTGNWSPNSAGNSAYSSGGVTGASYFPAAVMGGAWINYNGTSNTLALYNATYPQIELTGLNPDSTYILRMSGDASSYGGPMQYTVAGLTVYGSQQLNTEGNKTQGVTFQNVKPDASGMVKVYVNCIGTTTFAWISGLQIFSGTATNVGVPVVVVTSPLNGTTQSEGGNFVINATASESGGTITKVEFYADTTKIGEDDVAPYTFTWTDPDPGTYTITAKATDAVGTISTASSNVAIRSLNYFWSTTGNIATGGDTSFVGTVDSNRLAFRTKNIERMTISAIGNVGIGTDSPTAQLHTTGSVRFGGLTNDSTPSRILVSDSTGKVYYENIGGSGLLSPGPGLGGTSTGIALGDSIPGPGPHSFTSNRYEYLNGNQFSFGGSVNDPVNLPVFRMYNNGDLAVGTTMDRSVSTGQLSGMRYYNKLGILQIGATDRLDTTLNRIVYNNYQGSGILINSDDSNHIRRIYGSVVAGDGILADSGFLTSLISGETMTLNGHFSHSIVGGYWHSFTGGMDAGLISGATNHSTFTVWNAQIGGSNNIALDTVFGSLTGGTNNSYGGLSQFTCGQNLYNRAPMGAVMGNANVDFSSLGWTPVQTLNVPNLGNYPLFALGNSSSYGNTLRSNAVTVLYNGRTQINTTGMTSSLTQAQVTPAAALDVVSTNTGVLLPRLTTAQRNAIVSADLQNGLLLYNTDSSAFQYYNGTSWNSVGSGSGGTGGRWLFSNGTAYDTSDNIAIGTNNAQGYKLAVNGTGIFTKLIAKPQANWPDYVFDKGYKLPSLNELELYIREHHHLPDVSPESEVAQHGIDLGSQQSILLKKVEELTLYVLEQQKELEQIKAENKRLAAKIAARSGRGYSKAIK